MSFIQGPHEIVFLYLVNGNNLHSTNGYCEQLPQLSDRLSSPPPPSSLLPLSSQPQARTSTLSSSSVTWSTPNAWSKFTPCSGLWFECTLLFINTPYTHTPPSTPSLFTHSSLHTLTLHTLTGPGESLFACVIVRRTRARTWTGQTLSSRPEVSCTLNPLLTHSLT